MPARRTLTISPPNTSPRNSLAVSDHATVDAVLKNLKQCTRHLQSVLETQHLELQVLEKLYYKGNNQHRTALFWRRVSDIRRFGRRLEGADLYGLIEGVRISFWSSEARTNPKALKGPWTCYPDAQTVQTVLQRLVDIHTLVRSMHDHVTKAHNHLNLELQTGAFLQLILTLTAISSRLAMLQIDIQSEIEIACQALYTLLLSVLHPTLTWKAPSWLTSAPALHNAPSENPSARASRDAETPTKVLDIDEDIGTSISLKKATVDVAKETTSQSIPVEDAPAATDVRATQFTFAKVQTQTAGSTIVRTSASKETKRIPSGPSEVTRKNSAKRGSEDTTVPLKVKKTKKKKDEIDDIFGF